MQKIRILVSGGRVYKENLAMQLMKKRERAIEHGNDRGQASLDVGTQAMMHKFKTTAVNEFGFDVLFMGREKFTSPQESED